MYLYYKDFTETTTGAARGQVSVGAANRHPSATAARVARAQHRLGGTKLFTRAYSSV